MSGEKSIREVDKTCYSRKDLYCQERVSHCPAFWDWKREGGPGWRRMSGVHCLRGPGAYFGVVIIIPTLSISSVSSFISKGI